jgi:tape measure domain-containing protein
VIESTRNESERYALTIRRLNRLAVAGVLPQENYNRAMAAARARYIAAAGGAKMLADNTARLAAVQGAASATMAKLNSFRLGGGSMIAGFLAVAGAKHSIGLAADFQATSISMEVLMKDAKASKALIEDLYQYAAKTPFQFPEVTAASKQLLGFGVAAKDIMPTIKNLGNLSSGLDIPLGELANTFGRNRAQAHIFSRDINEFTSRGIPLIQQLAKQFGTSSGGVMKLVEAGKVGFKDVEQAISAMTGKGGQFEGLTDRLSTSMKGLASTAKDDLNTAFREVGNTLGEFLLPKISQAAKDIAALAVASRGFGETDPGKSLATNDARLARKNATNTGADTSESIRRNIQEQQDVLKQHAAVSARIQKRSAFNPVDLAALPGESQQLSDLSRRLNQLATERTALEKLRRTQRGRNPTQLDVTPAISNVVQGAGKMARAFGDGAHALDDLLRNRAIQLRSLRDGFKDLQKGGKLISDLRTQGDTFGMNARQAAIYKAKLDQIPEAILKIARANSKRVADMEADKRIRERDATKTQDLTSSFHGFKEAARGPAAVFKDVLKEIEKLEKGGFGSTPEQRGVLDKTRGQAAEDFFARDHTNAGNTNNPALVAGTSSFYSAINKTLSNSGDPAKKLEDKLKRILEADKRREVIQRQQLAALKKAKVANF